MTEIAPLNVLLLEDNPVDVRLLQEELREAGAGDFHITCAEGLAEALACLERQRFDVVLTDLSVPDSFGLATVEALLERAGEIPVVVLTGSEDDNTGLAAVQLGAQDYLVKGETSGELMLRSLQYAIERKQTEVALRQTNEQLAERVKKQLGRYNEALQLETVERYRIEAALRESEQRFRATFEQVAVGMAHIGTDGVFLRVNLKLCEVLGYGESELLSLSLAEIVLPEDADNDLPQRKRLLNGSIQNYAAEKRYLKKNGGPLWLRQSVSLVRNGEGDPNYFVSVFEPLPGHGNAGEAAARDDLERRLAMLRHELEEANAELDGFSYSVSHDLRAPLRAVIGFSRILARDYAEQLVPEARQYLDLVNDGAQRLDHLIRDILAYSRLGRHPVEPQRVDLNALVTDCLRLLQPEQEGRNIEFAIAELPFCVADPALVKELLLALLSNAIKFTKGRNQARIEVGVETAEDEQRFYVRDNGIGFDMRYAHKLFGVFQRLHRADEYAGTGIGLAIAQRIVHKHHGRIWVDATPDRGATFFFTLPAGD